MCLCVYELEASYLFLFEIWNMNNDVDEEEKNNNSNNHAVHLFFVCSLRLVEYLEHIHSRSFVHAFISDQHQLTNGIDSRVRVSRHLRPSGATSPGSRRSSYAIASFSASGSPLIGPILVDSIRKINMYPHQRNPIYRRVLTSTMRKGSNALLSLLSVSFAHCCSCSVFLSCRRCS